MTYFEQEIYQYELQVRRITVIGAHFLGFEMSWRSSEATEVSTTAQVSPNQLDLSQIFQTFFDQKKLNKSNGFSYNNVMLKNCKHVFALV